MANREIKSFGEPKEGESLEAAAPIKITVAGKVFEAYGEVVGAVQLDFIRDYGSADSSVKAKAIDDYLKASFDEETYAEFNAVTRDPKNRIKLEVFPEIVGHLVEERSSRPSSAS